MYRSRPGTQRKSKGRAQVVPWCVYTAIQGLCAGLPLAEKSETRSTSIKAKQQDAQLCAVPEPCWTSLPAPPAVACLQAQESIKERAVKQARLRLTRGIVPVVVTRLVVLIPVCLGLRIIARSARAGVVAAVIPCISCTSGIIMCLIWRGASLGLHARGMLDLRARRSLLIFISPRWGILSFTHRSDVWVIYRARSILMHASLHYHTVPLRQGNEGHTPVPCGAEQPMATQLHSATNPAPGLPWVLINDLFIRHDAS